MFDPRCYGPGEAPGEFTIGKHSFGKPEYCERCAVNHRWCNLCGENTDEPLATSQTIEMKSVG